MHTLLSLTDTQLAVLTGLAGLGIAVMQGDEARAQEFGRNLSNPAVEAVAKEVVDILSTAMQDEGGADE